MLDHNVDVGVDPDEQQAHRSSPKVVDCEKEIRNGFIRKVYGST